MKKKPIPLIYISITVLCISLAIVSVSTTFSLYILSAPLSIISVLLRNLSLAGASQNIIALILYSLFSLSPILFVVFRKNKKLVIEDIFIVLSIIMLFYSIYFMINPTKLATLLSANSDFNNLILSGAVYSLILAYLLLHFIRRIAQASEKQLFLYLKYILHVIALALIIAVFAFGLSNSISDYISVKANNSGVSEFYTVNYVFILLSFILNQLPNFMTIITILFAQDFLTDYMIENSSKQAHQSLNKLISTCKFSLIVSISSSALFNTTQVLLMNVLLSVNTNLNIPVLPFSFLAISIIFSKLVKENGVLKEDLESFI